MFGNPSILGGELLTPAEVATLFRVDATTVARWAREGRLTSHMTPGGRHRFPARQIHALLEPKPDQAGGSVTLPARTPTSTTHPTGHEGAQVLPQAPADQAFLPRRVRTRDDSADLSELAEAVRHLVGQRPDLARPVPAPDLVADLIASLSEVHTLALAIGAEEEAADIARLIDTLRGRS